MSKTRFPDITVNRNGRIDISARVAHILQLANGDILDISEGVARGEVCISVRLRKQQALGRHRCRCYTPSRTGRGTFRTWSKEIAAGLLAKVGNPDRASFLCGYPFDIDTDTYIPIITRTIDNK